MADKNKPALVEAEEAAPTPVLDFKRSHGEIYGAQGDDTGGVPRYVQDGHYFAANGAYLRSDPGAARIGVEKKVAPKAQPADKTLTAEEIPALLADPRAAQIMEQPLDQVAALVAEHGGPAYSGEQAMQFYAAWLLKHAVSA
jgi:hypothetical protein